MLKKCVILSVAVIFMFAAVLGRIGYIIFSRDYLVSSGYNSYSVIVDTNETQLYYSDGSRLNNNDFYTVAVIRPETSDLSQLRYAFDEKEIGKITSDLSEGYPVVYPVNTTETKLKTFKISRTKTTLNQFISRESSGLLSHIKTGERKLKISYHIDARGRLLSGDEGTTDYGDYNSREGYVLTFDNDIQQLAYEAAKSIKSGCVIVMDCNDSSVLACVNKPDDSYINKAVEQYSVGSVFKIIVAACALENGINLQYNCTGKTIVGDTTFSCQKSRAHGFEDLQSALANSCNCYFANLALNLGSQKLLNTAESFGFNSKIKLSDLWEISAAGLPSCSQLNSKGELALFGFGQGKLSSSPLQLAAALCAVANGGKYNPPRIINSKKERNGSITELSKAVPSDAVSARTSNTLLNYLRTVVTSGTAFNAETSSHKSAGKTGTAQTGQYIDGKEQYNTWFAGVYPYDNPEYCIVVMCENGKSGAEDCCPVFRTIVENLKE